jgi:hypothetical protein
VPYSPIDSFLLRRMSEADAKRPATKAPYAPNTSNPAPKPR